MTLFQQWKSVKPINFTVKKFNLPAAIVQEKEPIAFPKMLDDIVLYLRRFIIDPKNCSFVRQSRQITSFQTFD